MRGRLDSMLMNYRRAEHLSPTPELSAWLKQYDALQSAPALPSAGDSARPSGAGGGRDTAKAGSPRR